MKTLLNLSDFYIYLLLLAILVTPCSLALQNPSCHNGDRSALLQFKQSFVFDNFLCIENSLVNSWRPETNCCSWDGVECDSQSGHMIGLNLSSSCLFGSINSSSPLFQLVHLTNLDLSYNNFNLSRIPEAIQSLSRLAHLNLSFSNFASQVPSEMLELSGLVSLDLSMNLLTLHNPSLKDLVEKLSGLTKIHLSGVNISSRVPDNLSNLTSLQSLVLERCLLLGDFPSGIFWLPNLRVLSIRYNPNLSGYLPDFNKVSTTAIPLEILRLGATNFSGQLPVSIAKLESLTTFTARQCFFEGEIPSSIGNLTKLNVLDLSENYFRGSIPLSIGNLSRIEHLSISHNNFDPKTLDWIGQLTSLNILDLASTNTFGEIPSSIGNLTQLTKLRLDFNKLSGQISDSIFRFQNIGVIVLSSNELNGTIEMDSFLQMKTLYDLQLSNNHLSVVSSSKLFNLTLPKFKILRLGGCNLSEFPSFLQQQHELEALMLANNNITGYIPKWLFGLERLTFLDLSNNFLKGFEDFNPKIMLPWTSLTSLHLAWNFLKGPLPIPPSSISIYDVSGNKFSGNVSPLFCNLKSLSVLSLSDNNLTGKLPSCLSKSASSSLALNLRNNSFSGKIPEGFTTGCSLELVDFSQNKFEGEFPRSLANCSRLEIINLEENRINDVFPSWLGVLPHLRVLSLRSNGFYGSIEMPLTKFEFSRLQIMDLSNNKFVGKLPFEYLENSVSMKSDDSDQQGYMTAYTRIRIGDYIWTFPKPFYIRIVNKGTERAYNQILEFFMVIDLSSNEFEGEIPETIGSLTNLQLLNLSNNILTGHIPKSLSKLGKLEALDLCQNILSGEIPTQLSTLTFLSIFNVSHNNLTGVIPHGNQFDTYSNDSFLGNPGLCGHPLSNECRDTNGSLPLLPLEGDEEENYRFEVNREFLWIGFGSGLAIGVSIGSVINVKKYEWLVKKLIGLHPKWRN